MHYVQGEPNSAWNWLERWTRSLFWKPFTQPKKTVVDYKSQQRNGGYAMETESVKSKRTLRRNATTNSDTFGPTSITTKRNFKKVTSLPVETVQEHPQGELEKVKRNLRKISNSVSQPSSDQAEIEADKPRNSVRRLSASAAKVPEDEAAISAEKIKKNNVAAVTTSDAKPEVEFYSKPAPVPKHKEPYLYPSPNTDLHIKTKKSCSEIELKMDVVPKHGEVDMPLNTDNDYLEAKLQSPLNENGFVKGKSQVSLNSEKTSNEEEVCQENQKTNKRRVSLSVKPEYKEDGLQKAPNLPSYMAATKSAKAKLSPRRLSSDGAEKYCSTRRHSLPSATNGKLSSAQTQRPVAVNGRVLKSDKSLGHGN